MTSALVGSLSRWDTCLEILRHFCFYPETLRLIVVGWIFTRNGLHKTLQTWQTGWSILDLDPRALEPSNHGFLIGRYLCFIGGRPLVMQRAHPRRLDGRSIRSSCPGPRVLRSFWESFSHPLVWACCKRPNLEPHSNVASHRNPLPQISRR